MTAIQPQTFQWDGEAMIPQQPRLADKQYVVGAHYTLEPREPRSPASHSHYFAAIHEAWQNLPEDAAERFPSEDHLRKFCLIKAGYRDERSLVCASKAEALRVAAFVEPADDFALVVAHEATVTIYTAKSQSMKAMGKVEFQKSKDAVLGILSGMIGTDAKTLRANTGQAA
jgi:hypothetical protein